MPAIRIEALGPMRIWVDGKHLPDNVWPTQKSRQLLEILLINHGRLVTADRLVEYLWPTLGIKQARNNLWVSISQARRVLEPDLVSRESSMYIHKRGEGYLFQPNQDHWIDFEAFQKAVDEARNSPNTNETIEHLQRAVDLYQGDLCADDPYAEWTIQPRRELREDFLHAAADLATAYAHRGEFRRAANLCRYSLSFDDSRESSYRNLMLYLYCAGERTAALHVFDTVRRKLFEEIGVEPAEGTKNLLQQIQNRQVIGVDVDTEYPAQDDSQAVIFLLSQMPLVGRARELGWLTDLMHQMQNGRSTVGLITGESGIGKSRLLQEAAEMARKEEMTILSLSCYQVEQNLLYEPLIDLARQVHQVWPKSVDLLTPVWLQELALLVPEIIEVPRTAPGLYEDATADQQGRLYQAVLQYLSLAATDSGLVLIVEDIQWADDGTLQFLHYLGSRIDETGILLLLSYRQEEVDVDQRLATFLHHIKRQPSTTRIHLDRLTKSDLERLLCTQSLIPVSWGDWLYKETTGNPYFIVSILQSLVERQLLPGEPAGHSQPPPDLPLPHTIKESIKDRLRQLGTRERVVLEWIAVYGRPLDFQTLKMLSSHTEGELLEVMDHVLGRNLVLEDVDGIEFSHHKIGEVIYDELSVIRKRVSHRKIGQTLTETREGLPALLAYHYEQAGETELATKHWLQAGQAALGSYALRLAVSHFEKVLALADDATAKLDAFEGLGHALTLLDEIDQATIVLQAGITLSDETGDNWGRARLGFRYAQAVSRQHPPGAGEAEIRTALTLAKKVNDESLIARVLLLLNDAQASEAKLTNARESIIQARSISHRISDKRLEAQTLNALSIIYTQLGDFNDGIDAIQKALSIESTDPDPAISTFSWNVLGRAYGGSGKYQQAIDAFDRCRQQAAEIDDRFFLSQVPNMLGWLYRELYAFERAERNDQESLEFALRFEKAPIEISAHLNLCMDWMGMNRWDDSYSALKQIEQRVQAGQFGFHEWRWQLRLTHIWGSFCLQTGDAELALSRSDALWNLAKKATAKKYLCLAQQLRGDALTKLARLDEATDAFERSVQLAESISYKPVLWEARRQLAGNQPENDKMLSTAASILIRETADQLSDLSLRERFIAAPQIEAILAAANGQLDG